MQSNLLAGFSSSRNDETNRDTHKSSGFGDSINEINHNFTPKKMICIPCALAMLK